MTHASGQLRPCNNAQPIVHGFELLHVAFDKMFRPKGEDTIHKLAGGGLSSYLSHCVHIVFGVHISCPSSFKGYILESCMVLRLNDILH